MLFLDAERGYDLHKEKGCDKKYEIFKGKVSSRRECAEKCNNRMSCASFQYWGGKNPHPEKQSGYCTVSSSCTRTLATDIAGAWIYVKRGYSSEILGGM